MPAPPGMAVVLATIRAPPLRVVVPAYELVPSPRVRAPVPLLTRLRLPLIGKLAAPKPGPLTVSVFMLAPLLVMLGVPPLVTMRPTVWLKLLRSKVAVEPFRPSDVPVGSALSAPILSVAPAPTTLVAPA